MVLVGVVVLKKPCLSMEMAKLAAMKDAESHQRQYSRPRTLNVYKTLTTS